MCCRHEPPYPAPGAIPSMSSAAAACTVVDKHDQLTKNPRAVTVPEGQRTLIEKSFWESMGPTQKAAVVSHERAHVVIGLDCPCESCADKVGGYLMSQWGFTDRAIAEAYQSLRVPRERNLDGTYRDAAAGALEGAKRGARALAARGLTGKVDPNQRALAVAKAAAAKKQTSLADKRRAAADAAKAAKQASAAAAAAAKSATTAAKKEALRAEAERAHAAALIAAEEAGTATRAADEPTTTSAQTTIPTPAAHDGSQDATTSPVGVGETFATPDNAPPTSGPTTPVTTSVPTSAGPADVPKSPAQEDTFSREVKVQIVAGIVVAVILAFVLGRA
jgi:hypothetical protein